MCVCVCVCVWVTQLCLILCGPKNCSPPVSSVHGILQARILEWVAIPFLGGSFWHRDWTQIFCIAGRFLTICEVSESHSVMSNSLQPHRLYSWWNSSGQNTGVDSLFLLQGIFPTQGSNPGLPHCRWLLYHLSHQGTPGRQHNLYNIPFGTVITNWNFGSWPSVFIIQTPSCTL